MIRDSFRLRLVVVLRAWLKCGRQFGYRIRFRHEAVRGENMYTNMVAIEQVLEVLAESLPLAQDLRKMGENAPLLGAIPELDSMAITAIIVGMEERFNIVFDENELDAQAFETAGTLRQVVASKLASQAECKGN